jgi:hypothetical protein
VPTAKPFIAKVLGLAAEGVESVEAALTKAKRVRLLSVIAPLLASIARGANHAREALAHRHKLLLLWQILWLQALSPTDTSHARADAETHTPREREDPR